MDTILGLLALLAFYAVPFYVSWLLSRKGR
jgi:hypothetical protein